MGTAGAVISRREALRRGAAAVALTGLACTRRPVGRRRARKSPVAILKAASYEADLADTLARGTALCGLDVRGKRVLLKPNLVEHVSGAPIHTPIEVLAAAIELVERLGAAEIVIGEGPGHRRDTRFLTEEAGYRSGIGDFDRRFVDLNLDEVEPVAGFGNAGRLYLPRTALRADLIVSVARMKTHHWAGATLAMKNLFGVVPGALYGWPKNFLHHAGISRAAAGLCRLLPRSFAIVDGIVGMEGNGPIQGRAKPCGVVVMGPDLAAVDATCCRIMGIDPEKIEYLRPGWAPGEVLESNIEQRGESVGQSRTPFALMPEWEHVRLA